MSAREGGPRRTCIGCRRSGHQSDFIRFVAAGDGTLMIDYRHKLPGRGAYCCLQRQCIEAAVKKRAFARALKNPQVTADYTQICSALREQVVGRVFNLLGIARKAGAVLSGSQMVLDALSRGDDIAMVLLAEDVSDGIGDKIRHRVGQGAVGLHECFDKAALGQALGLAQRSVVAIKRGRLAQTIDYELQRYVYVMGEL